MQNVPGIHVFPMRYEDVNGWDKPGATNIGAARPRRHRHDRAPKPTLDLIRACLTQIRIESGF
jgi:hypothetical protein